MANDGIMNRLEIIWGEKNERINIKCSYGLFSFKLHGLGNLYFMRILLLFINHYSSKLQVWSWQKLWANRQKGIGYRNGLKG